jgi:hypothetical protein
MPNMERTTGADGPNAGTQRGVERAREEVTSAVGEMKQAAAQAGERLKDAGRTAASSVAEKVRDEAAYRKDQASGALMRVANELDRTASNIATEDAWAKGLLTSGASALKRVSTYLSSAETNDLVDDLRDVARRHPAIYLGASVAVGFVLARLAKAAAERAKEASNGGGYATDGGVDVPPEFGVQP